jgi:insertion element IS1 protein InsB
MQPKITRCFKVVGDGLKCPACRGFCIKHGKTGLGKLRYKCKNCGKTCIDSYDNQAYVIKNSSISNLVKEGCGIRSIGRLLNISTTTVLRRILLIAKSITKPAVSLYKSYEVDEMRTFYQSKNRQLWIVIALQKDRKTVVDFAVGSRTKATLQKVIKTLSLNLA